MRPPPRARVAEIGVLVFAGALAMPLGVDAMAPAPPSAAVETRALIASALHDTPSSEDVLPPVTPAPTPEPTPEPTPTPVPVRAAATLAPPPTGGTVVASWYGPGFYGNRTACGQLYTPEIEGVAHRTLPCGTMLSITSPAGITVVVPVIDRGPFIAGRTLDLSNATRGALQCSDLCTVRMEIVR